MASYQDLPKDNEIAGKVVDATSALEIKRCEMGWLGIVLGDANHKPGSIAFLTIALSFILLAVALFGMSKDNPSQATAITLFGGLISASVGYLFGKSSSS